MKVISVSEFASSESCLIWNERFTDASQIEYIHIGAQKLEEVTCLKFVPYDASKHTDYITVQVSESVMIFLLWVII